MALIKRKIVKSIFCPKKKRFESIYTCALVCPKNITCPQYKAAVSVGNLEKYIEKHQEYQLIGVFMPVKKTKSIDAKPAPEKTYWIILDDERYQVVTESQIVNNPKEYLDKKIWDKPPNEYELVVALKKKK